MGRAGGAETKGEREWDSEMGWEGGKVGDGWEARRRGDGEEGGREAGAGVWERKQKRQGRRRGRGQRGGESYGEDELV